MVDFTKPTKVEKLWSSNGDMSPPPDDSKIATGFIVEIPTLEQFNYIENKQDAMLAHINQRGVADWDTNTTYLANKSYVNGSNGIIYRAVADSGGPSISPLDPVTDISFSKWKPAFADRFDVYTKTETSTLFLSRANNLSDLANATTARANLGVYSSSESTSFFARRGNNLNDLANSLTSFNNIKQQSTESFTGVGRIATDAEANTAVDNTVFLTPRKLRLGFSLNLSTVGHIAFPTWLGGLILNWGVLTVQDESQRTATFSKPFPTAFLQAVVSPKALGTSGNSYAQKSTYSWVQINNSIMGIQSARDGGGAADVSWFAIGY